MNRILPNRSSVRARLLAQCPECELYAEVRRVQGGGFVTIGCVHAAQEPEIDDGRVSIVFHSDGE